MLMSFNVQGSVIMLKSFSRVSLAVVLSLSSLLVVAADRPQVGAYVQAYSGEENVSVYVVRLGAPEKAEALVLVAGVDSAIDGVIQKATVSNDGNGRRSYRVKSGNQDYEILRLERTGGRVFLATHPHGLGDYRISYDQALSRGTNAEHLLTQWLEQKPGKR